MDRLRELLDADPALVNARGGDGQHPLHFAASVEVIDLLVERGAELDARDLDHSATAAQWNVQRTDICRRMIEHGATPDIFMAAALNDIPLLERVLATEPDSIDSRVGECRHTKPIHPKAHLHMYQWKLHGEKAPMRVARRFRSTEAYDWLHQRSSKKQQLLTSCWYAERDVVEQLIADDPTLMLSLDENDKRMLAEAAWEGRAEAVTLMLDIGFDPHVRGDEESTPLDRAAFHGHRDVIEILLARDPDPPLAWKNAFGGTPLGACVHGSVHGWKKDTDYPGSVEALIRAGGEIDAAWLPCANAEVDAVLREHQ